MKIVLHRDSVNLRNQSEALPVHDGRTRFIIFALRYPHLLEGAQGRQDGTADPHGIFALWRCDNLDLHRGRCECRKLFGHSLADSREHGGPSRQDNVRIQILTDVQVALHDRLESGVMDTARLFADERWLEEHLRTTESLASYGDDVAIRELVRFLLIIADDLTLGGGRERITPLSQNLHHVLREITA